MRTPVLWTSIGAAGSFALTLYAARHAPPLLALCFLLWVLVPFAVLFLVDRRAPRARWLPPALVLIALPLYAWGAFAAAKPKTPLFLILPAALTLVVVAAPRAPE